jgi:hypothetical protein
MIFFRKNNIFPDAFSRQLTGLRSKMGRRWRHNGDGRMNAVRRNGDEPDGLMRERLFEKNSGPDGYSCGKIQTGIRRKKIRRLHFSPGGV